jgi:hypothetical protein
LIANARVKWWVDQKNLKKVAHYLILQTYFKTLTAPNFHPAPSVLVCTTFKGDLYIVILVEKEVSHYWKYGYQEYNAYSL